MKFQAIINTGLTLAVLGAGAFFYGNYVKDKEILKPNSVEKTEKVNNSIDSLLQEFHISNVSPRDLSSRLEELMNKKTAIYNQDSVEIQNYNNKLKDQKEKGYIIEDSGIILSGLSLVGTLLLLKYGLKNKKFED